MITKRSTNNNKQNIQMKFDRKTIEAKRRPKASASLASTIQFSNHHAPRAHAHPQEGRAQRMGNEPHHGKNPRGGGPGAQKHAHTMQAA